MSSRRNAVIVKLCYYIVYIGLRLQCPARQWAKKKKTQITTRVQADDTERASSGSSNDRSAFFGSISFFFSLTTPKNEMKVLLLLVHWPCLPTQNAATKSAT